MVEHEAGWVGPSLDSEDEAQPWAGMSSMGTAALIDLLSEANEDHWVRVHVLDELRRRRSPAHGPLLLGLLLDVDLAPPFVRVHLLGRALREGGATGHAAGWLTAHSDLGWLEPTWDRREAEELLADAGDASEHEGAGLTTILSTDAFPGHLRALAGAELVRILGMPALPRLEVHLGGFLVDYLEEAARDEGNAASELLDRIATSDDVDVELRIDAATASARLSPDFAEQVLADLALSPGLDLRQRLSVLELAVDAADSATAAAALAILQAIDPPAGVSPDLAAR